MAAKDEVKAGTELAVVKIKNYALVTSDINIQETLEENLGDTEVGIFSLDTIKVPSGGGVAWELKDITQESGIKTVQDFEGVIVGMLNIRNYWEKGQDEEGASNTPPDCFSYDTVIGHGNPGGVCVECPFAEFGSSKKGTGQLCKQNQLVFIMMERSVLPTIVKLPPTSLKCSRNYMMDLVQAGKKKSEVITRFKLKKIAAGNGKPAYAEVMMSYVEDIPAEFKEKLLTAAANTKSFVDFATANTLKKFAGSEAGVQPVNVNETIVDDSPESYFKNSSINDSEGIEAEQINAVVADLETTEK